MVPHGHWNTMSFIAALPLDRISALWRAEFCVMVSSTWLAKKNIPVSMIAAAFISRNRPAILPPRPAIFQHGFCTVEVMRGNRK